MSFELNEANKRIKQLEEQIIQKNEQLAEYREIIKDLKKSLNEKNGNIEKGKAPFLFGENGSHEFC